MAVRSPLGGREWAEGVDVHRLASRATGREGLARPPELGSDRRAPQIVGRRSRRRLRRPRKRPPPRGPISPPRAAGTGGPGRGTGGRDRLATGPPAMASPVEKRAGGRERGVHRACLRGEAPRRGGLASGGGP